MDSEHVVEDMIAETCNSCGEIIHPLARRCDKCGCCADCCHDESEDSE